MGATLVGQHPRLMFLRPLLMAQSERFRFRRSGRHTMWDILISCLILRYECVRQANYDWLNTTDNLILYDPTKTVLNSYKGGRQYFLSVKPFSCSQSSFSLGVYQQTTSGLSVANQDCYELEKGCFSIFGFQYKPGFDNAYITWVNDDQPAWTIMAAGMGPDPQTEISARPVPMEPMVCLHSSIWISLIDW